MGFNRFNLMVAGLVAIWLAGCTSPDVVPHNLADRLEHSVNQDNPGDRDAENDDYLRRETIERAGSDNLAAGSAFDGDPRWQLEDLLRRYGAQADEFWANYDRDNGVYTPDRRVLSARDSLL